jgi:hypothetical protein
MCDLCERELPQHHVHSRRHFLKAGAAASLGFLVSPSVFAQGPPAGQPPADTGRPGKPLHHPWRGRHVDGPGRR